MCLVTVPVRNKFNRESSLVSHVKRSESKLLYLHFQNYLMNVSIFIISIILKGFFFCFFVLLLITTQLS